MPKGQLYIISGPSGSGKDTIIKSILQNVDSVELSISSVTRAMRAGESEGEKYHFISRGEFESLIEADALLEYNVYLGEYYGTVKSQVFERIGRGTDVILEIDVNGAKKVKERCPQAVSMFILPPSLTVLRDRLAGRGTDSAESVDERMQIAVKEIARAAEYDYIILNDELGRACGEAAAVIRSMRCKAENRKKLIEEFLSC